jgi:hypothetical protein
MGIFRRSGVVFLLMAAPILFAQAPPPSSVQAQSSQAIQAEAWQIVVLANKVRAEAGAVPLKWDAALAASARTHCLRMVAEGKISHQYAGEPDVGQRAANAGAHFSTIEENVALGPDPATIHDAWMYSPHHRSNLLNPDVDHIGVAVVASRTGLFAVADYERIVPVLAQAQVEATITSLMQDHGVTVLHDASLARTVCATDDGTPNSNSGPRLRFIMRWQDAELTRLPQALLDQLASGMYRQAAVGSCPPQGQEGSFTLYRLAVLLY